MDPLTGHPLLVAEHRSRRPHLPTGSCPFCPGGVEAPDGWDRGPICFPNRWPALTDGVCEVLVYSPDHLRDLDRLDQGELIEVLRLWRERSSVLQARADVEYVLIFENAGPTAGGTIEHPHAQIFGFPFLPPRPSEELRRLESHCVLCDRPADALVLAEGGAWSATVLNESPWPYSVRILPTRHLGSLHDADDDDLAEMAAIWSAAVRALSSVLHAPVPRFYWLHQHPSAPSHLHLDLVFIDRSPGVSRVVGAGELASGVFITPISAEAVARRLRAAAPMHRVPQAPEGLPGAPAPDSMPSEGATVLPCKGGGDL